MLGIPKRQWVILGVLMAIGAWILGSHALHMFLGPDHLIAGGLLTLGKLVLFLIFAPFIWLAGDLFRKFALPTFFFAKDTGDLVSKKVYWLIGPQSIAIIVSIIGFYAIGDTPDRPTPTPSAAPVSPSLELPNSSTAPAVEPSPASPRNLQSLGGPQTAQVVQSDQSSCNRGSSDDARTIADCARLRGSGNPTPAVPGSTSYAPLPYAPGGRPLQSSEVARTSGTPSSVAASAPDPLVTAQGECRKSVYGEVLISPDQYRPNALKSLSNGHTIGVGTDGKGVPFRSRPGIYLATERRLPQNTDVAVICRYGTWLYTRLDDGLEGWVLQENVQTLSTTIKTDRAVSPARTLYSGHVAGLDSHGDNYLSFRSERGGSAVAELARLGPDTHVIVLRREGNWLYVRLDDGRQGWVFGGYVQPDA